MNIVDQLLAEH